MSNPQLQQLADSALLRVLQYVVSGVMLPLALWFGNRVLNEMDDIQSAQNRQAITSAELVLKVQALEREGIDRATAFNIIREQVLKHDYALRRLEEDAGRGAKR